MVILLALLAGAGEPTAVARWERIPAHPDDGFVVDLLGEPARRLPWTGGNPLRVRCPDGAKPRRVALARGGVVHFDDEEPQQDGKAWLYPAASDAAGWNGWLLAPADCRVERLRTDAGPWTWAWAEREGPLDEADLEALVGQRAAWWIDGDPLRQAALRPPGPHPVSWGQLDLPGTPVELADERYTRLDAPAALALRGPLRVRVQLRDVTGRDEVCIEVDGSAHCALGGPARETLLVDGDLRVQVRTLEDGSRVARARVFQLGLGPGAHSLSLPDGVIARVTAHRAETWGLDSRLPDGAATWTQPPGVAWESIPLDGGVPTWLADPEPGRIDDDELRWLPLDALPAGVTRPEPGNIALWLEPEPGPCHLRIGDARWVATAPTGLHTFDWVGPSEPDGALLPEIEGCRAWIRTRDGLVDGARSLSLQHRLTAGGRVTAIGDDRRPARLEVALRRGQEAVTVRARALDGPQAGRALSWTVAAAELAPPMISGDGASWSEPLRMPLPTAGSWVVETSGDVLVRIRQPERPPPATFAMATQAILERALPLQLGALGPAAGTIAAWSQGRTGPMRKDLAASPPPPPARTEAELEATAASVHLLSGRVARATTDEERALALLDRARLLVRMSLQELAARDLVMAEELVPEVGGVADQLIERLRLSRERTLFGEDRWRPAGADWVLRSDGEVLEQTLARAVSAQAGDPRAVAAASPDDQALAWWLRAVHGGQVLTRDERIAAFRAVASSADPDHAALGGLRGLSDWRTLHHIEGVSAKGEVAWPDLSPDGTELLYPDGWPAKETVRLGSGSTLRLAARSTPWSVPVRCRALHADSAAWCRFVLTDTRGEILQEVEVDPWGTPGVLEVPRGGLAYLTLESRDAMGNLRWTRGRPPTLTRDAWYVGAGQQVSVAVLGPTVILADLRARRGEARTVRVREGGAVRTVSVPSDGRALIPVDTEGPVRVTMSFDRGGALRLLLRRAARGGPTPTVDRRWLQLADHPPPRVDPDVGGPQVPFTAPVPRGLPANSPPMTVAAELAVGSAEPAPPEPGQGDGGPLAASALVGVQTRPLETVWLEADAGLLRGPADLGFGWAHFGADWRAAAQRNRATLLTDITVAHGTFSGGPLTTARLKLGLRTLRPLEGRWVLEGVAAIDGNLRSDLEPISLFSTDRSRLWSRYREDHRTGLDLTAALRHRHGPWWSSRLGLSLGSNAPGGGQPLDSVIFEARTDVGLPRIWTRWRFAADLRLPDADRDRAFVSPLLEARAAFTAWPGVSLAVRPWVWGRWRPLQGTVSGLVGLEGRFGPPRALADQRPSTLAARHLGEAGFWQRAATRWPANPPVDGVEDGAPLETTTSLPADLPPVEDGS